MSAVKRNETMDHDVLVLVQTFHASIRRWIALHTRWTVGTVCLIVYYI